MKKIVVSQRVDFIKDRNEVRDSLDIRMILLLEKCNLMPIPMPNNIEVNLKNDWLKSVSPSGVILSGGNNLNEFTSRDSTEKALMRFAAQNKLPLLGICRGMQILAVENGVKLIKINNHIRQYHQISGSVNEVVNSYHEYGLKSCPKDYKIQAQTIDDKSIEAIKHKSLPWEGWMWHPERESPFRENDMIRISRLFA